MWRLCAPSLPVQVLIGLLLDPILAARQVRVHLVAEPASRGVTHACVEEAVGRGVASSNLHQAREVVELVEVVVQVGDVVRDVANLRVQRLELLLVQPTNSCAQIAAAVQIRVSGCSSRE